MRNAMRGVLGGAAVLLLSSCSEKSTGPDPAIALSLSSPSATVGQGQNASITVLLMRTNFGEPVTLSVDGLPDGVSATLSPTTLSGTVNASTLVLSAAGSAAPSAGTAVTVHATGEGVTEKTITLDLTVTVTGSFTLGLTASTLRVARGGGGMTSVLVNRAGGNASAVTVAAGTLPAGVTATVGGATTGGSVSVSLAATDGTAVGAFDVDLTASAPGFDDQSITLHVTVINPPSMASLTVPFCAGAVPPWFAVQNDGYNWQRVQATGASFTFDATATLGIAYLFQVGTETQVSVFYATRDELATFSDRDCAGPFTITGTVTGLDNGETSVVTMGASIIEAQGEYALEEVSDRPLDLVATSGTVSGGQYFTPTKMVVRRNVDPQDGTAMTPLDFDGASAFAPELHTLTISGLSGQIVDIQNTFVTGTFTYGQLHSAEFTGGAGSVYAVPAAAQAAGDLHELFIDMYDAADPDGRSIVRYFAAPANQSFAVSPTLTSPTIQVIGSTPYTRHRALLPSQTAYPDAARFVFLQGVQPNRKFAVLMQTRGYMGATPASWDLIMPDFSAVPGFSSAWMLTPGQVTLYQATAYSGRPELLFAAAPVENDVVTFAYAVNQFVALRASLRMPGASALPRMRRPLMTQYLSR